MGNRIYLEPLQTAEDARTERPLSEHLREKLIGLDYRVRKQMGRYFNAFHDGSSGDEEEDDAANQCCVAYQVGPFHGPCAHFSLGVVGGTTKKARMGGVDVADAAEPRCAR